MSKLALRYLGDFQVLRDGQELNLPPSRKTRALLAYLSLNPRKFRREFLCELLWEVPDDPRGSLRWSLSKLRRLIDDDDRQRIVADRSHVEIDVSDAEIDVATLFELAGSGLAEAPTEALEQAAGRYRANFLEGLDLPNFHDFHSWCIAERERVAHAQAALLRELVTRLGGEPGRALPYARALVALSPYDEAVRADLIRLLVSLGHAEEAEQHFELGRRMLQEIGLAPEGLMAAARRPTSAGPKAGPGAAERPAGMPEKGIGLGSGLIGREPEAAELLRLLQQVREQRQARFALVRGEPGIGKTRLIETVTALARGAGETILGGSAYESESIRPFALWVDALHRRDAAAATEIFGDRDAGNRDRLFDRLSDYVAAAAADDPLLLVFDDLHWCDDSSAAAIHYVARMCRERPILGILSARDSELRDNVPAQQAMAGLRRDGLLTEIALGPLPPADLKKLIAERAPGVQADALSRQCGGNPLLAIELARAEQEGDNSKSLKELVGERLARLSIDGVEVLQWAAVLDPHFDIESIAELAGIDAGRVGEIVETAERQGMLGATGRGLKFPHDLLARAVYSTLSPVRRQVMHRRAADRLERGAALDPGRAADLAHHAVQSGDDGLAARAMVSAGRLCLRFYANEEALSLVRRGMQLLDRLPEAERVCLTIDLHAIRLSAEPLEDWEASARECARLAEQALDHGELGHARLGYHLSALLRWQHGQWADAREESLQSERAVRYGSEEEQVVGMAETAKCLAMIERDLPKADAMLMEAQALSTRRGFSHFAIATGLGILRFHENRLDEAAELFKESRTLCKTAGARIDEFLSNEYLAMIEIQRGDFARAREICGILETIGDKLRIGSEGPFARALSALCDYALDDDGGRLVPALDELRRADAKHRLAYTLTRAAQLDCERGRLEDAARRAAEALDHATLLDRATEMALARAVLACTCRQSGDIEAAETHRAAIAELEKSGVAAWASPHLRREAAQREAVRP